MFKALRGAISVAHNDKESMGEGVILLLDRLLLENKIEQDKIISVIFSQTDDLNIANPAAVLRSGGLFAQIPLFCTKEPIYENSLPMIVRVLIHFNGEEGIIYHPVYLGEAALLRKDLESNE